MLTVVDYQNCSWLVTILSDKSTKKFKNQKLFHWEKNVGVVLYFLVCDVYTQRDSHFEIRCVKHYSNDRLILPAVRIILSISIAH